MTPLRPSSLMEHMAELPDPRMRRTQRYHLFDILAIAMCAVIAGADHRTEVVEFGQVRLGWFSTFFKAP
jgi:DDE_Tnp_1-associated